MKYLIFSNDYYRIKKEHMFVFVIGMIKLITNFVDNRSTKFAECGCIPFLLDIINTGGIHRCIKK